MEDLQPELHLHADDDERLHHDDLDLDDHFESDQHIEHLGYFDECIDQRDGWRHVNDEPDRCV